MFAALRGVVLALFLAVNTIAWASLTFLAAALRLVLPPRFGGNALRRAMNGIIDGWVSGNRRVFGWLNPTPISVQGLEGLGRDQWVLVLANHQSWTDILLLQNTLRPHLPPLKFFTKRELLWLPFLGQAMWALDFPFMHRYSPAYLERHPEKRGKDLETTRRACAHFRHTPTAVINFVEGTRWTPEKHAAQGSPYPGLLKPRAGGTGFVLSALGDQLDRYVDVTLCYHTARPNFWRYLCGRLGPVDVIIEQGPLPEALRGGDYGEDPAFREAVKTWLDERWQRKAVLLENATPDRAP